jgi:hypothetical protein
MLSPAVLLGGPSTLTILLWNSSLVPRDALVWCAIGGRRSGGVRVAARWSPAANGSALGQCELSVLGLPSAGYADASLFFNTSLVVRVVAESAANTTVLMEHFIFLNGSALSQASARVLEPAPLLTSVQQSADDAHALCDDCAGVVSPSPIGAFCYRDCAGEVRPGGAARRARS